MMANARGEIVGWALNKTRYANSLWGNWEPGNVRFYGQGKGCRILVPWAAPPRGRT